MADNLDEGCGRFPIDHLVHYATLYRTEVERGRSAEGELRELVGWGYGDTAQEVEDLFEDHLGKCEPCQIYFTGVRAAQGLLFSPKNAASLTGALTGEPVKNPKDYRRFRAMSNGFAEAHTDILDDANTVFKYIRDQRLNPEDHKDDQRCEDHIADCRFCQDFGELADRVLGPIDDLIERFDNKE